MKVFKIFAFSSLVLVIFACKKSELIIEKPVSTTNQTYKCEPLLHQEYIGGLDYIVNDETYHVCPEINPNNPNEVAYTNIAGPYPDQQLMIFNLVTNQKRILVDEAINAYFSWSRKDWILFQRSADLNIYKVKSNGDSLTQVTFDGQWFHAEWNYEGTKFIAFNKSASFPKTFVLDENGVVVDTLSNWTHKMGDWSHPDYYVGIDHYKLVIMNPETEEIIKFIPTPISLTPFIGVGWIGPTKIFYSVSNNVYTYDLNTNQSTLLKGVCYKSFSTATHSSDYSKLIFGTYEESLLDVDHILHDAKLIYMNADGTNEEEIIIP